MASTGGYIQGALEQTPNAEGGANAVSSVVVYHPGISIDMDPKVAVLERKDELRGGFWAMPHSGAASYDPDGTMEGRVYPNAIGQLLSCAIGVDTPTTANSTKVHTYTWNQTETPQTMQLIFAPPAGGFWKATGVGIDELDFKVENNAWNYTAKLMGLKAATISDPTLTTAYEVPGPWRAGEMALSWLSGSAVTEEFTWHIKNGLKQERSFTTSSLYPTSLVYEQALPVVGGTISKRSLDSDDWAELTAGTPFAASITMTHSEHVQGTSIHYTLTATMPACQYVTVKADAIKNERRNKASFDWEARYDTQTAGFCAVVLVNDTATYATY
jgi:hypothetical protein